jgi:hypothetical protein
MSANVPKLSGDGGTADGVRRSAMLGGLAIDVFAVRDPDDEHHQVVVGDRVDNSISTDSDSVAVILAGQLFAPDRPRLIPQRANARHDALPVFLFVNGLDLLGRGRLNQDPIACHAA